MALPKFLQPFLPSYDISKMKLHDPDDRREIITQILNYGTKENVVWLFKTYSQKEIKNVVSHPMRGCWQRRALNYWAKFFNIKLPKFIYEVAIFSLHPRPKLTARFLRQQERLGKFKTI